MSEKDDKKEPVLREDKYTWNPGDIVWLDEDKDNGNGQGTGSERAEGGEE